jgi:hypothetical protein
MLAVDFAAMEAEIQNSATTRECLSSPLCLSDESTGAIKLTGRNLKALERNSLAALNHRAEAKTNGARYFALIADDV